MLEPYLEVLIYSWEDYWINYQSLPSSLLSGISDCPIFTQYRSLESNSKWKYNPKHYFRHTAQKLEYGAGMQCLNHL